MQWKRCSFFLAMSENSGNSNPKEKPDCVIVSTVCSGCWISADKMVRFEGAFVEDFPTDGVWYENDGAKYRVLLMDKALLSHYFDKGDKIFIRKDKVSPRFCILPDVTREND
jgi:hypothetical protein